LHLSKGQLVGIDGRLQTRQCDDGAGYTSVKFDPQK
jgi:single-stranded DNA-binding protein